jgi:replication-associated recombination protein RarA
MWFELYRPKNLSECILEHIDDTSRSLLVHCATASELPNILLHGPAGTGKTTIARILSNKDRFAVYPFNGSLFGKREVEEIQDMVSSPSLFQEQRCFLIEEIDGATRNAQKALRALMESGDSSWICTANDLRKIIPPLLSRMMLIDCSYAGLAKREAHMLGIVRRCRQILLSEGIHEVSEHDVRKIVELNYPDVRQTINALQLRCMTRSAA